MDLFKTKSRPAAPLRERAESAASTIPYLMAQAEKAVASILHGDHRQRKTGTGERFWQFREYNPTDRPQDIDWRQSGKTDRIFIRQKEWQTNQTCLFWHNTSASMDFHSDTALPTKSEAAKIILLALAILMTHGGEQVGFLGSTKRGRSESALQNIADHLSANTPEAIDFAKLGSLTGLRNSKIFLIGDFIDDLHIFEENFKAFGSHSDSGFVIQILDPAELELSYDGRVVFEKPGTNERELVQNIASIRAEYQKRMKIHIAHLEALCRSCHWQHVLHRTDANIRDTLMQIWTALNVHSAYREMGS